MRRKLLNGKMMVVLAVIVARFMMVGVAEEDLDEVLRNARIDASGQWKYVVNTDSETATVWQDPDKVTAQVDVPREIDGFRVTAIGNFAFESSILERITLPDTVISIGDGAFQWCFSLTEIVLPDSLIYIGDNAFVDSSLSQITLPDTLTSIGGGAFNYCTMLIQVILPDTLTSIGEGAFGDCWSLTEIALPNSLTSIGEDAFCGCEKLTLTVTKGSYAEQYAKENKIPYVFTTE